MSWLMNDRRIVHLNVADFAVAVERVVNTELRRRPVVVAAEGASRAAVYDMSEEAYQAGVRKGMLLRNARKLCRDARIVSPHVDYYERAMSAFLKHVRPYSPLIETGEGNGHLFVDLTGTGRLFGPPADVAWRVRKNVKTDLGLDPIWSVAPNKLLAKVGTRVVKPDGEYIVQPGEEEEFLKPLPVHLLPGVEREDLVLMREFNISRVGQAVLWTPDQLSVVFGRRGFHLYKFLRGLDDAPVLPVNRRPPGIVREKDFDDDTNDRQVIEAALYKMVEQSAHELRQRGRAARRVAVTVYYSDGVRLTRQRSNREGTAGDFKLFFLASKALELAGYRRTRVRRLKLTLDRLAEPPAQMELFPEGEPEPGPPDELLSALDDIRNRFGSEIIRTGRTFAEAA